MAAPTTPGTRHTTRIVLAGALGNVLEWYDFGLYGLLAPVLASLFFPTHNRSASLLEVYGGFALGFAVRPVGALILGHLADRVGRRPVLLLSVTLMGIATVAVGLLPTWHQAGLLAPILLLLVRLFQGFSVGGEFVDSVTYLVEATPQRRRGLAGSVANIGSTAGMLLAAAVAALVVSFSGSAALHNFAWRIPFLLGGLLAAAAFWFRRHLPETRPESQAPAVTRSEAPIRQAIRREPRLLLAALLFTSGYGIVDYLAMVLLPTWAHRFGHIPIAQTLRINTAGQALALVIVPLAAFVSDRFLTRRALLTAAFLATAAFAWQAFSLAAPAVQAQHALHPPHSSSVVFGLWTAQLSLAFLLAIVMGAAPAFLAEQFHPTWRVSAHAVVFNLGIGIAGGTAPMLAMALVHAFHAPMAPALYLAAAGLISAIGTLALRDNSRKPLL